MPTCDQHTVKKIIKKVGTAINRGKLIRENDKVMVALSGGKDSLVLLDTLVSRIRFLPIEYEVSAVHVLIKNFPSTVNFDYLEEFCNRRNVHLNIETISIDMDFEEKQSRCFLCSWYRRKVLFTAVKELKYQRLAFGHHMDDILETLVLNMAMNGRISAMPLRLSMFNGEFDIIRPLALLSEKEIEAYSRIKGFRTEGSKCPYSDSSTRMAVKRLLSDLEKLNPKAKKNIFAAMKNIDREYLP